MIVYTGRSCSLLTIVRIVSLVLMPYRKFVFLLRTLVPSSEVKLIYDRRSVGQSILVSGSHDQIFFFVWRLRVFLCVAPSLTRGLVCDLLVQSFLVLARAVTLGSKSRRTHDHILLSHLRLPQPGGPGLCFYIPQEQGGPDIPPGTGFPFVSSYDSQGCGGGILTRLHTGSPV
jgi:hypothetical protein